jgi:protein-disulfide isomerase
MYGWFSIQAFGEAELVNRINDSSKSDAQKRPVILLRAALSTLILLLVFGFVFFAHFEMRPSQVVTGIQPVQALAIEGAQANSDPAPPAATSSKPAKPATSSTKSAPAAKGTGAALGAPVKAYGMSSAPITMEVFSDYECPSCRNLFETTLRQMIPDYVASGKVYLIHRDYPLPMHKYGYEAARWLNAAARIGQFQSVEAALYDNQNSWAQDGSIEKYVAAAMSPAEFKRVESQMRGCGFDTTASVKPAAFALGGQAGATCPLDSYIEQDRALGNKIPVQATPTYVITYKGNRLPAGSGIVSWPILKQFFDSLLSQ